MKLAGRRDWTLRRTRTCCAMRQGYTLANEGVDTRLIQDFLGHADIRHTAHYTALSPRRLAAVRVR